MLTNPTSSTSETPLHCARCAKAPTSNGYSPGGGKELRSNAKLKKPLKESLFIELDDGKIYRKALY